MLESYPFRKSEAMTNNYQLNKQIMLKTIHEATEVSLNAYNEISRREIPKESQDRFRFLGQCLNALTKQLDNENDSLSRTKQ